MDTLPPLPVPAELAGQTLAAVLRARLPGLSWKQVRQLIAARRVTVRGEACLDDARRLREGELVELHARPAPRPWTPAPGPDGVVLRHLDRDVVVAEKPSGVCTVRHPLERAWNDGRRELSPTLEDLVGAAIARREGQRGPRLRIVHRLDKGTSGLVAFARTVTAESALGKQFHAHTVTRRYLAVVPGRVASQTVRSTLVRDRGDGRRGSTRDEGAGKLAVTHLEVGEELPGYTALTCRLETGRTHQIRIHLAELGHPVCGDAVYVHRPDGRTLPDASGAPRLALHALELGFAHPATRERMHWTMPPPPDLTAFLARLRASPGSDRHADRDQVE